MQTQTQSGTSLFGMLIIKTRLYLIVGYILMSLTLVISGHAATRSETEPQVRLVLQITIDGLRADLLNRYQAGFGKDCFRLLLRQGAHYTNAHYQHTNTETIVDHTTLATGTVPAQHGMVGNEKR